MVSGSSLDEVIRKKRKVKGRGMVAHCVESEGTSRRERSNITTHARGSLEYREKSCSEKGAAACVQKLQ